MNKEYQSETLRALEEEKEKFTNIVDTRKRLINESTNNGAITIEELEAQQSKYKKRNKHLLIGAWSSAFITVINLFTCAITLKYSEAIANIFFYVSLPCMLNVFGLYMIGNKFIQKKKILTDKIDHLKIDMRELDDATTSLDKVVEQIQSLSTSDNELVQLENNRDKAQAMLNQFLNNRSKKEQSMEEALPSDVEDDQLETK